MSLSTNSNNGAVACTSLEKMFETNLIEFFDKIGLMVIDMTNPRTIEINGTAFIDFDGNAVEITKRFMLEMETLDHFFLFAAVSEHWGMVIKKDPKFVTDVLAKNMKIRSFPFDPEIICCPFRCYEEVSNSENWEEYRNSEYPVSKKDIDLLMRYMISFVRITCKAIYRDIIQRRKLPELVADAFEKVDLIKWGKLFEIDYTNIL